MAYCRYFKSARCVDSLSDFLLITRDEMGRNVLKYVLCFQTTARTTDVLSTPMPFYSAGLSFALCSFDCGYRSFFFTELKIKQASTATAKNTMALHAFVIILHLFIWLFLQNNSIAWPHCACSREHEIRRRFFLIHSFSKFWRCRTFSV